MRNRRILIVLAICLSMSSLPADAAQKKKTISEEWQATAAPFPGADDHSDPATECGTENVSYTIHPFSTPAKGTLHARIFDFQGEWDLYITDSDGVLLASSVNFMAGSEEKVTVSIPAPTDLLIYACNFLGGPIANGELRYVYRG